MQHIDVGSFSILGGGGQTQRGQLQYKGGGGVLQNVHTCMHACTCCLNVHTPMHACTHKCMHACMHTCIDLRPVMKINKIKACDLYGKNTCNFTKSERNERGKFFFLVYIAYKLLESAYIYTHALLKSKQWMSIYDKPKI